MIVLFVFILFYFILLILIGKRINILLNILEDDFLINSVTGLIAYNFSVNILHLFIPLNIFIPLFLFVILYIFNIKLVSNIIIELIKNKIFLLITFFIVALAVGKIGVYDTYLYHDQNIQWFQKYPIVLGLANLHGRFGFNSTIFTLYASQLTSIWNSFYIFNALVSVLFYLSLNKFYVKFGDRWISKIGIILFGLIYLNYSLDYLPSPSPDLTIFAMTTIFVIYLLLYKCHLNLNFLILLIIYLPTIKLNVAVFSFLIFVWILIKQKHLLCLKYFIMPFLLLTVWLIRNVLISGQVIYPLPEIYLTSFDFRVPYTSVVDEKIGVTGWAQSPGKYYKFRYLINKGTLNWVPNWWKTRFSHTFSRFPILGKITIGFFSIFILIVSMINLMLAFIKKRFNTIDYVVFFVILNSLFWFFTGPDWRFGITNFALLFLLQSINYEGLLIIRSVLIVFIILALPYILRKSILDISYTLGRNIQYILVPNGIDENIYSKSKEEFKISKNHYSDTLFTVNNFNLKVYYSKELDQTSHAFFPSFRVGSNKKMRINKFGNWLVIKSR